jgi:hypothetical protein
LTLNLTLDQVRDRQVAAIGVKGLPTPWWPDRDPAGNDCVAFQTLQLGLRTGHETINDLEHNRHFISIAAFRAHYGYDEPALTDMEAGDLVGWKFSKSAGNLPEHMEFVYSVDHNAGTVTTIGANTSPAVGVPITVRNRGVWKKTRAITDSLVTVIRPEYVEQAAATDKKRKSTVRFIAAYLNNLPALDALPNSRAEEDGIAGPVYWTLVQTWGRRHGIYGPTFHIDGVPGPRTHQVEAAIFKAAKA